ncbi:MAG: hypothetical protein JRI79_12535 [Deltaproteobacteria bacterium]|nr:hypothetical protein [Deltaproteobacteria bacterium]
MSVSDHEYIEERGIGRRNEDRLIRDRLRKHEQIFKVGQIITSEINLDALFEVIMLETNQILGSQQSTVFLYDKKTMKYAFRRTRALPVGFSGTELP